MVGVHSGAVEAEDGLGHESGVQPVLLSDGLHHVFEGHAIVRAGQRVRIAEVDLVLARRHLVMGPLDLDAHGFQSQDDVLANFGGQIPR